MKVKISKGKGSSVLNLSARPGYAQLVDGRFPPFNSHTLSHELSLSLSHIHPLYYCVGAQNNFYLEEEDDDDILLHNS